MCRLTYIVCHMGRRIHVCHMGRRIHVWSVTDSLAELERLSDTAGRKVSVVS